MKSGKYGIEGRLVIWFALASLIVIAMLALSYYNARRLRESEVFWVEHGYQIIAELEASYITLREAESDQRTYLVNDDERYLNSLKSAADKFRAQIDRLETLTADNPGQYARVKKLEALVIERIDILQTQARLKQESGAEAVKQEILDGSGIRKMAEIYSLANEIRREEESLLAERRAHSDAGARNAMLSLGALGAAVMATLAMAYTFISREIIGRRRTEDE
jgi:CHASE3 domain sensor protein